MLAGLFAAREGGTHWTLEWLAADVVYAIAVGIAVGAAIGLLAAWSVKRLHSREMLIATFDGFHAIATALVIYGVAESLGGYGFLGVFAGGLAFRRYEADHELNESVHEGAERLEKLLELAIILVLGSMLTRSGLATPGWGGWLLRCCCSSSCGRSRWSRRSCARAWITRTRRPSSRGSACAASARCTTSRVIAGEGVLAPSEQALVVWTAIAAVLVSIVVHGITAGPSMRRLLARRRPARRGAGRHAATRSSAVESSRSLSRSSTAASSSGWWIRRSPGAMRSATAASVGVIVSPDW